MNLKQILYICCAAGLLFPSALTGQSEWEVPQLTKEIQFDGIPDEPAWDDVQAFPLITQQPTYGLPPSQESAIKLAFDDQYIYLGASLFVDEPDMIKAVGMMRDFQSASCDWVGVQFDSYYDKQNAVLFYTNPNAIRWDATISNDATPGDTEPLDINWNAFWEVKTVVEDLVWHAEMKIPLSSLRFNSKDSITTMGICVFRYLPSTNELYIFPDIPFNWGAYSHFKPSAYAEGTFRGLQPRKPLYISPYILTGYEQAYELNEAETAYDQDNDPKFEPGLDVKYGISSNTTLDLTLNTDFAQVEADDQQFNLTRFSLVFPEKRKFFLERASVFDFGLGGPNNLFYSRKIGLYEGEPVRIIGGVRVVSKLKGWDIGFMDMQTGKHPELPSENFGVFRVKKQVFNVNSYAGGMLTSRIGVDGNYNLAYGLDAVIRLFKDEYLTLRWAQTFDEDSDVKPLSLDPTRFLIDWTRRRENGFAYSLLHTRSGVNFDPGIGLEVFDDYYATILQFRYNFLPGENSRLQSHIPALVTFMMNDVTDNSVLTWYVNPGWSFSSKKGWMAMINLEYNYESLREEFELTDSVAIPIGNYGFSDVNIKLTTPWQNALRADMALIVGQFYDGYRISPQIIPTWNLSEGIELGATYQFDHLSFRARDEVLNNHIFGIRGLLMFNTKLSLSGFVQYNTAINKVISNVRFRYNPREGTDLYLVFNEGRNTYLERELPNLPAFNYRSFLIKYTYTFDL